MDITPKEKKTLSALYKSGMSSVSDLAKHTLINRTTLYPILENLAGKGLVSRVRIEGRVMFQALPVEELKEWAERKKKEALRTTDDLVDWAKKQKKGEGNMLLSEIKYFEGLDGVMSLYHDTWRNNKEKKIYALTDYERAYEVMGDEFLRNDYFKRRVEKGVRIKSMLPDSKIGRADIPQAKTLLRDMRFIDLFEDLGIEINVYDDKVALFAFDKKRPSGILIKNETIANAFKHILKYLWGTTKKPT